MFSAQRHSQLAREKAVPGQSKMRASCGAFNGLQAELRRQRLRVVLLGTAVRQLESFAVAARQEAAHQHRFTQHTKLRSLKDGLDQEVQALARSFPASPLRCGSDRAELA